MLPPSWAFQVENFNPPPHDELICSICQCVFCEPVECPCRHVFCSQCIGKWISMHRSCPICRKRTPTSALQPVNRIIKNLILGLSLKCKNASIGCENTMTLESVNAHVKVCNFELEECPNSCGKWVFRKDLEQHNEEDCPFRRVTCNTCTLSIDPPASAEHNCVEALLRVLQDKDKEIKELNQRLQKLQSTIDEKNKSSRVEVITGLDPSAWSYCSSESDIMDHSILSDDSSTSIPSSSSSSMNEYSSMAVLDDTEPLQDVSSDIQNSYYSEPIIEEPPEAAPEASPGEVFFDFSPSTSTESHHSANKRLRLETPARRSDDEIDQWRRFVLLDSNDLTDGENNVSAVSLPSDLPTFNSSAAATSTPAANSSELNSAGPSSKTAGASGSETKAESPASVFKRTLSLLKLYTAHDSDPEWLPPSLQSPSPSSSDSDFQPASPTRSWGLNSDSDNSNSEDSSNSTVDPEVDEVSSSSYEVQVPTPTIDLLERYCNDSGSDPEWSADPSSSP